MRDNRFVAVHRGGLLTKNQHHQLMNWAHDCVLHVFTLLGEKTDQPLVHSLTLAKAWVNGQTTVGEARQASVEAIKIANNTSDPVTKALARAVSHAAATAHMADHALRAITYTLKAVELSGLSMESEKKWQDEHLSLGIREMIKSVWNKI